MGSIKKANLVYILSYFNSDYNQYFTTQRREQIGTVVLFHTFTGRLLFCNIYKICTDQNDPHSVFNL